MAVAYTLWLPDWTRLRPRQSLMDCTAQRSLEFPAWRQERKLIPIPSRMERSGQEAIVVDHHLSGSWMTQGPFSRSRYGACSESTRSAHTPAYLGRSVLLATRGNGYRLSQVAQTRRFFPFG